MDNNQQIQSEYQLEIQSLKNEIEALKNLNTQNLTEINLLKSELIERDSQYYFLLNSVLALIWKSGVDKLCYYFNEPWLKFTGRKLEQEVGNGWAEGVHPDDFDSCLATYVNSFDQRKEFRMEYRIKHYSGEYKWILDLGTPNYNSKGEFIGYLGHCFDINDRKVAEGNLLKSEIKYEKIFSNSPTAVSLNLLSNGQFLDVNDAFTRITGFSREEILGKNSIDLEFWYDKGDRVKFTDHITNFGKIQNQEYTFITKNGGIKVFSLSSEKIYLDNQLCSITFLTDNTEIRDTQKMLIDKNENLEKKSKEYQLLNEELRTTNSKLQSAIKSIEKNEKLLNMTGEMAKVGGWEIDTINSVLNWTNEVYNIHEVDENFEPNIETAINFYDDASKPIIAKAVNAAIENDVPFDLELTIISINGNHKIVNVTGKPQKDSSGRLLSVYGTIQDITDRKKIETELINAKEKAEENETNYRLLLDSINDAVFLSILEENGEIGNFIRVNNVACTRLEYSEEELLQKSVYDINPNFSRGIPNKIIDNIIHNKSTLSETSHITKSGKIIPVETNSKVFQFHGKTVIHTVARDITERKLVESKVREYDIQFRKLSANVPDLIYQFTRRIDGSYCVPIASDGIVNIFGCKPEDVIDNFDPIAQVLHPDDAERIIKDIEESAQNLSLFRCEFRVIIPGQGLKWIYSKSTPEKLPDGSVTWYGFNTDITQQKKAEEELVKANNELIQAIDRAEESDRLKTAFLQNMSHEIRTPLNGILGFSNLLNDENLSYSDIKEYTSIIIKNGERLLEIINNILEISKIETGQVYIHKAKFSLNYLLHDLHSFLSPLANIRNLKLICLPGLDNDLSFIETDHTKLNQILINLINNAIKFTPNGEIKYGYEIINNEVLFFVKDTGIGIAKENYNKIFGRFSQIHLRISDGYDGTGLGLAISKGLVEVLGGKIWFESELNKGTYFYFTLPYQYTPVSELPEIQVYEQISIPKKIKVLVAEDDYTSYLYIEKILKDKRFELIHAENGEQAINFVCTIPDIDLVLMDIRMPGIKGDEATKIIKAIRSDLPIIAQTAYAFHEEKIKFLEIGCNDYIAKPINKEQLLILVQKYI